MKNNYKNFYLSIMAIGALALMPMTAEGKVINWPNDIGNGDPDTVLRATPINGAANSLYIASSYESDVINILSGSVISGSVYGSYVKDAIQDVSYNTVNIYGGIIGGGAGMATGIVAGANSDLTDANYNTVNLYGGTVTEAIYGGLSKTAQADNNTVNISGGTVKDVAGGYVSIASAGSSAKYNTVNITGGTITGNIYGGDSFNGEDSNNKINISGNAVLAKTTKIYGGYGNISKAGNTLNIDWAGTIGTLGNFETINFVVNDAVLDNGNTALNINGSSAGVTNTNVKISGITATKAWNIGESITLISKTNGLAILHNGEFKQGLAQIYQYEMGYVGATNAIVATINKADINPDTGDLPSGAGASNEFLKGAAELLDSAGLVEEIDGQSRLIGAIKHSRSKIGGTSNFNINGTSMLLGLNRKFDGDKGHLVLGGFVEAGWGSYDTNSDFSGGNIINSTGKTSYYGVGIAALNTRDNGVYTRATVRFGHVSTSYKSNNLADAIGKTADYELGSRYYGLNVGVGKVIKLNERSSLDVYGKYLYLHQNAANATISGDKFEFDAINSHRLRTGLRLGHKNSAGLKTYIDLSYEYEFNGRSRATTAGQELPSIFIKGGTAIMELGFNYKPKNTDRFHIDLGLQGYIGKRQGMSGNVQMKWTFI